MIRGLLPCPLVVAIGSVLVAKRAARLGRLSLSKAFDEVYHKKMWQQEISLSGAGSEGKWAGDYAAIVIGV